MYSYLGAKAALGAWTLRFERTWHEGGRAVNVFFIIWNYLKWTLLEEESAQVSWNRRSTGTVFRLIGSWLAFALNLMVLCFLISKWENHFYSFFARMILKDGQIAQKCVQDAWKSKALIPSKLPSVCFFCLFVLFGKKNTAPNSIPSLSLTKDYL